MFVITMITRITFQSVINDTYCLRLNRITHKKNKCMFKITIMFRNCTLWILLLCFTFRSVSPQCSIAQTCISDISIDDCWGTQVLVPGSGVDGCCTSCQEPSGKTLKKISLPKTYLSNMSNVGGKSISLLGLKIPQREYCIHIIHQQQVFGMYRLY